MLPRCPRSATHFVRLLKNKSFKEESMAKARLYTIGTSTTMESNKSQNRYFETIPGEVTWRSE
jgi:hypothetical protein